MLMRDRTACVMSNALVWLCVSSLALVACTPKTNQSASEPASESSASSPQPTAAEPKHDEAPTNSASSASTAPGKDVTPDGYQIIRAQTKAGETNLQVKAPPGWQVVQPPTSPDPHAGKFTLAEALKGLPGKAKGGLVATIKTSMGTFQCDLYEDKAPNTVANFAGLARGTRKFWSGTDRAWVGRPYYDGTNFHRVIPGFMIQGGDFAGDGSGRLWYSIPDEIDPTLKHDRVGQLCMANRGPNTNEAQFFVTEDAAPHLDGSYSIFGQCSPPDLVYRIARVPQSGPPDNRPLTPVMIEHVTISRVSGGAGALASKAPAAPPVTAPNDQPGIVPAGSAVHVPKP